MENQENKQRLVEAAEYALSQMALYNQYITADTLITVLEQDGYTLSNYSVLGGVFTRAAKVGIIDKSPSANRSKSHSAKTVWRSLIYERRSYSQQLRREVAGTKSQIDRVLALIRRVGGATDWELSRVALKYTSVISELRKDGYHISARRPNKISSTRLYILKNKSSVK